MQLKKQKLPYLTFRLIGHDLKFGWHGYLWYDVKTDVDSKNHFI